MTIGFPEHAQKAKIVPATAIVPDRRRPGLYHSWLKRPLDIILVLASAPFTLTLLLCLMILQGSPRPLYSQMRVGRDGRAFRIWKLRTMVRDADKRLAEYLRSDPEAMREWMRTQKLKHDPRITRIGRILRKSSLDELPQIWNVLRGEMSLVGPRPMMCSQKSLYPGQAYFRMRPGITGSWQISDRNEAEFTGRAAFDTRYESEVSLLTDLRILARTIAVVLRGTGY